MSGHVSMSWTACVLCFLLPSSAFAISLITPQSLDNLSGDAEQSINMMQSRALLHKTGHKQGALALALEDSLNGKIPGSSDNAVPPATIQYGSSVNPPVYLDAMISPVFVDKRPSSGSFIGCFPCKNGMSWWTKFSCEVDSHCKEPGAVMRLFLSSPRDLSKIRADEAIPRFVITRNPMIRALSGFLTWVGRDNEFNYVPDTFAAFVGKLDQSRLAFPTSETYTWSKNPHWRPQMEYCGLNHGEKFKTYKAEERGTWGTNLFSKLGKGYAKTAARLNFTFAADQKNGNDGGDCPGYFCHAKAIMGYYFTADMYEKVRQFYWEDIREFNYETEVETLFQELFPRNQSRGKTAHMKQSRGNLVAIRANESNHETNSMGSLPKSLQAMSAVELAHVLDEGIHY